jgi:mannose-1-phosphate guanylyltransferase/mannose-6-phosphate isomerase
VVPFNGEWSDVGSWSAVAELMERDEDGNHVSGIAHTFKSSSTFILSLERRVVALGVKNLLIVDTPDAILVADRDHAEGVKDVVTQLKYENLNEIDSHRKASRPWGSFDAIDEGEGFKVKRIVVSPKSSISLQRHQRRSEHWVVVEGLAEVTLNDKTYTLKPNESTYIPKGETHRLKNVGDSDLIIIEVQVGDYLGEDDIERFEDSYGRKDAKKNDSQN